MLLLDIVGKRPLPTNPLVASVRGGESFGAAAAASSVIGGYVGRRGFTTLAQRFEEWNWRVVDGVERGLRAPEKFSDWHSAILRSVYVLIALALGEYGAIDRSADPKRKLQLAVL